MIYLHLIVNIRVSRRGTFRNKIKSYMSRDARNPVVGGGCEQQRHRPACASTQSDQHLCCSLIGKDISKLHTCEISLFELVSVAVAD